jgi:sulfopyruvate decarboxylase alpha subunit
MSAKPGTSARCIEVQMNDATTAGKRRSRPASRASNAGDWPDRVCDVLKHFGVGLMAYVPDAGHVRTIELLSSDPEIICNVLTTEEEGIAIAAGAWLGGLRGVLLMQSSGVGNCINMLSLIKGARFPLLTIVSMRGDFGEGNPWQFAMGQATEPVLAAMGVICLRVECPEDVVPTTSAALIMAFKSGQAVALLLSQRLIGAKPF